MTRPTIVVRPAAEHDIEELYIWLAAEAGLDVAERMTFRVEEAAAKLADMPGTGSPIRLQTPALTGIRKGRVRGFPNLLLFYRVDDKQLDVVRVLHAAQDWQSILDEQPGAP